MWPFSRKENVDKANRGAEVTIAAESVTEISRAPSNYDFSDFMKSYAGHEFSSVWIHAAVNATANSLAQVPLKLYEKRKSGELEEITKHPILRLFEDINPEQTYYTFLQSSVSYLQLTGNCFWAIERDGRGKPLELWVLRPDLMEIKISPEGYIDGYVYKTGGREVFYDVDDMVHIKRFSATSNLWGISPLASMVTEINTNTYSKKYNENFFIKGGRPSIVISVEQSLSDQQFERAKREMRQTLTGYKNQHDALLLDNGAKIDEFGAKPKDAEYLELMQRFKNQVLSAYGVPPIMIADYNDAGNVSNSKIQHRTFWENTMIPLGKLFESYVNEYLLPNYGGFGSLIMEFDFPNVPALREDQDKKAARVVKMTNSFLMINEARAMYNLPPMEGGDKLASQMDEEGENFNHIRDTFRDDRGGK